ncbi:MAG: GspH/FimT family pseudopilin [Gammaproteobacteria bacterium]|nr:GspH/FimT family pseudopilin [Gammaproteobacteria bacterium]
MVTVAIAGILLVAGAPALQNFSRLQQMKAAVNTLQNDLMMSRSSAVHLNTRVVACPGTPGAGCSDSTDWSGGWIVFADNNADRQRQAGENLIRRGQQTEQMLILSNAGRTRIRFLPDGSAPGSNSSITFCGPGGPAQARKLVISNVGRIRRDAAPTLDLSLCPT